MINVLFGLTANVGGFEPHPAFVAFFVILLLGIAILPLAVEHWWEHNKNKGIFAGLLSLPVLVYYLMNDPSAIHHTLLEYFSFIVLLWALYSISGGIVLKGSLKGTPGVNVLILAIGAVLANVLGTTGAAMLLIRPLLKSNEHRLNKKHTFIFFIFLVANVGGCLTPLGDPPLFLGFLRGVPFTWTLQLFPQWGFMALLLLTTYYIWDRRAYSRESAEAKAAAGQGGRLSVGGAINFLFIAGVLVSTLLSEQLAHLSKALGFGWGEGSPWRELIMIGMGLLSLKFTAKALREENRFNFGAIIEVAVLFIGIFITMIPALQLLGIHGGELGLTEPWHYFWASGSLSSFLDNAPTYLVFATAAAAQAGLPAETLGAMTTHPVGMELLKAVSLGAVFMGANTYIGNAPNFMVKAICEGAQERKVKMPSFFGYMAYSGLILIPLFVLVTFVFFILLAPAV